MSEDFNNYQGSPQYPGESGNNGSNGMAIASMVLGIVSILLLCTEIAYIGLICAIIGLTLGIIQKKNHGKNKMATAGIVCSIVTFVLFFLLVLLVILGFAALGGAASLLL